MAENREAGDFSFPPFVSQNNCVLLCFPIRKKMSAVVEHSHKEDTLLVHDEQTSTY